jgi:ribosome-binding protein aMBF1 (putative translation factor)
MALVFRNLSIDPATPVSQWPTEAVQAALERGDLGDWRRVVAEVRHDPWGRTARQVEEVLTHSRPYGVAELMDTALAQARADMEATERQQVADTVREAVQRSGLSNAEFATHIGTSASRLSTYLRGTVVPSAALMVRIRRVADSR